MNRHCPFPSNPRHCASKSKLNASAHPAARSNNPRSANTNPNPGTPSNPLLLDPANTANGARPPSIGTAPNALIASTNNRRPAAATTPATASSGFKTPLVVSTCTNATSVTPPSAANASATRPGSTARSSSHSNTTTSRRARRAISTIRRPYAPFTNTSSRPSRGTRLCTAASTANVPLPCTKTAACVPETPANPANRARTPSLIATKSPSRDPQSRPKAARVRADVVSGPGVSNKVCGPPSGMVNTPPMRPPPRTAEAAPLPATPITPP